MEKLMTCLDMLLMNEMVFSLGRMDRFIQKSFSQVIP